MMFDNLALTDRNQFQIPIIESCYKERQSLTNHGKFVKAANQSILSWLG